MPHLAGFVVASPGVAPRRRPRGYCPATTAAASPAGIPPAAAPLLAAQAARPIFDHLALGAPYRGAEEQQRFLADGEMPAAPRTTAPAAIMRDRADAIVHAARTQMLLQFPGIAQPGGALWPPARSAACWRDLRNFLRVCHYATAAQRPDFTNAEGMAIMRQLYAALGVPLDAMMCGVAALRSASRDVCKNDGVAWPATADQSFDHLLQELSAMRPAADHDA